MTIGELRAKYISQLSLIYPMAEARAITSVIFEDVTGLKSLYQSMSAFQVLSFDQLKTLEEFLERLMKFEPMQYVLGYEFFDDLKLKVTPDVLIPRPETLDLVNWVKESKKPPQSILDIGAGSGCIAISLKKHFPHTNVTAVDVSEKALKIAAENALTANAEITFKTLDILNEIPSGKFDLIVSNPPYVAENEKEEMRPNVLSYEPHLALFSKDPLLFFRRIATLAKDILNSDGRLYFEMNEYYANSIEAILKELGYKNIEAKNDLYEKQRMLRGQI